MTVSPQRQLLGATGQLGRRACGFGEGPPGLPLLRPPPALSPSHLVLFVCGGWLLPHAQSPVTEPHSARSLPTLPSAPRLFLSHWFYEWSDYGEQFGKVNAQRVRFLMSFKEMR